MDDSGEVLMSPNIPDVVVEGMEDKQGSGALAGDDCCLETSVENSKQVPLNLNEIMRNRIVAKNRCTHQLRPEYDF